MPALVLEGARFPLPLEGDRSWARTLPNSPPLWLIEGVGHGYAFVEAPEVSFQAIRKLLAGDWPDGSKSVE